MKFLCVVCDQQMKLQRTVGPDQGSVTLIYACPECGYPVAMMTNPHETQVVTSLGVSVGTGEATEGEAAAASKCPFTGMLKDMETSAAASADAPAADAGRIAWSEGARARLGRLPESVRGMAISGIEQYAQEHGHAEIDEAVLDGARSHFGI